LIAHPILLKPMQIAGKKGLSKLVEGFKVLVKRITLS
jgi:hypothetical protein